MPRWIKDAAPAIPRRAALLRFHGGDLRPAELVRDRHHPSVATA
jgi:hypothetical protein